MLPRDIQKKKNIEIVNRTKVSSLNGRTKAMISNGRIVGGVLDRTAKLANISRAKIKNAQMRIAHANPTSGMRWISMMGKITPPSEDPATASPMAAPLFARNHVETSNMFSP